MPESIQSVRRQPSKERLRMHIINQIESGALQVGDSLLPAQRLSEMFGTSVNSVRVVLRDLAKEGWVYSKHRIGTFVAERTPISSQTSDASDKAKVAAKRVVYLQPSPFDMFHCETYHAEIAYGVENYLSEHGASLDYTPSLPDRMTRYLEQEADSIGVIVVPVNPSLYKMVEKAGLPCVGICNLPENDLGPYFDCVLTDDEPAAYQATSHLIALGHKKICHIRGRGASSGDDHTRGYRRAMEEAGLDIPSDFVEETSWDTQDGFEAMLCMLAKVHDITAVFAANDLLAFGAIRAVHEVGRKVPEDVSVIGFGDWDLAKHTVPTMTTMSIDRVRLGQVAGQMALNRLAEPERPGTIQRVPAKLVERKSTQ